MTPKEFLEEIRRMDERLKQAEQAGEAFLKQLTAALVEHVYNWYPKYRQKRGATEKQIAEIAEASSAQILELYGSIYCEYKRGGPRLKKNIRYPNSNRGKIRKKNCKKSCPPFRKKTGTI